MMPMNELFQIPVAPPGVQDQLLGDSLNFFALASRWLLFPFRVR